jgi:hypothetical protein
MTVVDIVNIALTKVGHTSGITATTDTTREAWIAELSYDHRFRLALRRFPWPFATKYADLYLVRGLVTSEPTDDDPSLVQAWSNTATYVVGDVVQDSSINYVCILGHVGQQPPNATYWEVESVRTDEDEDQLANGDWAYAYRWPSDCLFARRIVPVGGMGRQYSTAPIPFRVGRDRNGLLIYSNQADANLEYTVIDCGYLYADDLFIDWFTWELACAMAPSLAKNEKTFERCMRMSELAFNTAAAVALREHEPERPGDAEWVAER